MNVFDRLKQLIHDEDLVDVLEDVALLNDVVEIGFWGNGPKRVSGEMSGSRRGHVTSVDSLPRTGLNSPMYSNTRYMSRSLFALCRPISRMMFS